MDEYAILLKEVRSKITDLKKPIVATAKEYIPKMHKAILIENPNLIPIEVRKKIENDCKDLWSKRTILDALPDEAKDLEKQKAGKQRNKNKSLNSAAITAAPKVEEKIVLDTFGNMVTDNESLHPESLSSFNSINRKNKEYLENSSDQSLNGQLLDFDFNLKFKDLRQYMVHIFNRIGDNGDIWFNGKINIKSGKVIEAKCGRIKKFD